MESNNQTWKRTSFPIFYLADREKVPSIYGSAVILDVQGHFFVVTAAHVLTGRAGGTLWLPGKGVLIAFPEGGASTAKDPADPDCVEGDEIDIAVLPIDSDTVKTLSGDYVTTPIESVFTDSIAPDAVYSFLGFPSSKFEVAYPHKTRGVAKYIWISGQIALPQRYKVVDKSPSNHIVIYFNKKKVEKDDGTKATPPDPHGMSGGGIWANAEGNDKARRLVGIGIEYRMKEKCLIGTRIAFVVEAIRAMCPELSEFLPHTVGVSMHYCRSEAG
jgi:hypothetical protein